MTTRQKMAIVALMALTARGAAFAQQADAQTEGRKWTLSECIDYALQNNLEVKGSELTQEQARAQVDGAKGQLMPSLSFSTQQTLGWRPWSQNTVALNGGTMTTTQSDATYSGGYSLSANWTVWDGGRTRRELQGYKLEEQKAEADGRAAARSVEEQIVQYYVQILYEAEAVRVADSTLAASASLLSRGVAMMAAGQLARADVAQLEAQKSQDEYALVSARAQLATYKMQLKQILEIVKTQDFDVATPDVASADVLAALPSVDDVFLRAMEAQPSVQASRLAVRQAEIQERVARAGHCPTVNLSAAVSTNHSSASNDGVGEQMRQNVNNSIGLSIQVPILDNRQTRVSKAKAQISRRQTELDSRQTENDVYRQVETYWLAAQSAQTQYVAALANEKSMSESFDLVTEQFRLGLKNMAEVTTGKSNLLTARQQALQSKYTALLNIALLKFYAGDELAL